MWTTAAAAWGAFDGSGSNRRQKTADGGGVNRQTMVATAMWTAARSMDGDGGGGGQRRQRTAGGGFMRDVIRGRSTYGCHFHEFPCMRTQALLALCTLAGIQIPGNNNCGQRGKGMKNTVRNDASSSYLKGKPVTKTIWLHWLHGLLNTFPPQTKRAYIEHNCA